MRFALTPKPLIIYQTAYSSRFHALVVHVSISMDLIIDLPLVNSYDSVLVVIDWFTKMAHFTPCSKTIFDEGMVHLLFNNVVRLH